MRELSVHSFRFIFDEFCSCLCVSTLFGCHYYANNGSVFASSSSSSFNVKVLGLILISPLSLVLTYLYLYFWFLIHFRAKNLLFALVFSLEISQINWKIKIKTKSISQHVGTFFSWIYVSFRFVCFIYTWKNHWISHAEFPTVGHQCRSPFYLLLMGLWCSRNSNS